jgi:hypothetical protein
MTSQQTKREGRNICLSDSCVKEYITILELILDLAGESSREVWKKVEEKTSVNQCRSLQQALRIRWDIRERKKNQLLTTSALMDPDPGHRETLSEAECRGVQGTINAILACLKAIANPDESTKATPSRTRINDTFVFLQRLGIYQETKTPTPRGHRSFWIDFSAISSVSKVDCVDYVKRLCNEILNANVSLPWLPSKIQKKTWLDWLQEGLNISDFTRNQGFEPCRDVHFQDRNCNNIRFNEIGRRSDAGKLIIIKADRYEACCLAYAIAAGAIEGKLTISDIYPIYIKAMNRSLIEEIKDKLSYRGHILEPEEVKNLLLNNRLFPIIDARHIGTYHKIHELLNDLPASTLSFVLSDDRSLLDSLKDKTCQLLFQASNGQDKPTLHTNPTDGFPTHNLPPKLAKFIGREREQAELKEKMSLRNRNSEIVVVGESGVGKTALVINVAYTFLAKNSEYDNVLFITAKRGALLSTQLDINDQPVKPISTFDELCFKIAEIGGYELTRSEPQNQENELKFYLEGRNKKHLIIIDNYETIEESQRRKIWDFFRGLRTVYVKTIFTSRIDQRPDLQIQPLLPDDARELAREEKLGTYSLAEACPSLNLTEEDISQVIDQCERLPLAIKWFFTISR